MQNLARKLPGEGPKMTVNPDEVVALCAAEREWVADNRALGRFRLENSVGRGAVSRRSR